jgi:hypothetical protein
VVANCIPGYPGPSTTAPAGGFLAVLGGFLVVLGGVGIGSARYVRRRLMVVTAQHR